ncbi:hypothetical protein WICPIJ_006854 [Wickerhamomyces pijperi]|uniref:TLC domain-containing protein n=1 Tax=Wickerhamomyces pijperi TaxID=599730 RepID=A0A9P8TL12_WICPI|nr:hypothetical protein WICPIJ_006854 [Wickerhamomyces pijperi]
MSSPPNAQVPPVKTRSRRSSSIGRIDLGARVRSLSTSKESDEGKQASQARVAQLASASSSDKEILRKIVTAYVELNYRHTWLTPLIIVLVVYAAYFSSGNYTESNILHQFVAISYRVPGTNEYGKGYKDLFFVTFYIIFFFFFREFVMQIILKPIAHYFLSKNGNLSKMNRFLEQSYAIVYYSFSGPFGFYIMYHSDLWYFNTTNMYLTYPNFTNDYLYKIFYLVQAAFWAQQACILVLQVEKPRKDFMELVFHHIVTILLIWASYVFHFTKMGLAIYITMDVSDFFLAISKNFNYLDWDIQVPSFVVFMVSWIYLRHYINLKILWSLLTEFKTVGNYTLNFATQQYKCWISQPIIVALLGFLQILNLYWLALIFKVLFRLLFQNKMEDHRSDSEDDDDDSEQDKKNQ